MQASGPSRLFVSSLSARTRMNETLMPDRRRTYKTHADEIPVHLQIQIKGDHAKQLERTKNFFCILLLAVFFVGAWAASLTFGWSSKFHPSLWLNPFLDPKDFDTSRAVGMTLFLHFLVVLCMVLAPCLVWLADIIRKKLDLAYDTTWVQNFVDKIVATTVPADEIDGEFDEDLEKYSWDAQETPVTPMPPPTGQVAPVVGTRARKCT
jgi:hypothetical protein